MHFEIRPTLGLSHCLLKPVIVWSAAGSANECCTHDAGGLALSAAVPLLHAMLHSASSTPQQSKEDTRCTWLL